MAIALAACSKGDPPAPVTVTVTLASANIRVGESTQASAVVRDSNGAVVSGASVTWSTSDGAVASVSAAGLVTALSAGSATITATRSERSGSAPLTVTERLPLQLAKSAGDGQTAVAGAAVPVAPQVLVTDSAGRPVAEIPVTFAIESGGGTLETTRALTGADGHASCGGWTLGSTVGAQTVSASIDGGAVTFAATAIQTTSGVRVAVVLPTAGQRVGSSFPVLAQVTSTLEISAVSVRVGTAETPLAYTADPSSGGPAWSGTVSTAGMRAGPLTVEVSAKDVAGTVATATVLVELDPPPVVTVASPLAEAVARPTLAVSAVCTDDAPGECTSLAVTVNGTTVASGTFNVSTEIDLSAYDGQAIDLTFTGRDTAGQTAAVTRRVYVEATETLIAEVTVPGPIWDVSGTRVLYVDRSTSVPVLRIRDTSSSTTEDVETGAALAQPHAYGFLTAAGAIYVHDERSALCLYEWRDRARKKLATLDDGSELKVSGGYAIYTEATALMRRDLAAGTSSAVARSVGSKQDDVAANGDVVYWSLDPEIFRVRAGTTTQLTSHADTGKTSLHPLTDGAGTVYASCTYADGGTACDTVLHDGARSTVLSQAGGLPEPGRDYAISGGYVAYTKADAAAVVQVFRHSAAGEQQLTSFESSSRIAALSGDGTVLIDHAGRRVRATPGATALQDAGASLGRAIVRDGAFHVLVGDTAFTLRQR